MTIPDPKFAALEMPWARAMQAQLEAMQADLDRRAQNDSNVNQGQNSTIQNLGQNIVDLSGRVAAAISAISLDMSRVPTGNLDQSRVTGTWTKGVNTTGTVEADAGVTSTGVYNNLVSSGAYKVQYINVSGAMGYVPSSRQFKQDIVKAPSVNEAMLAIEIVTFRYIQAVEELGDGAAVEWGVIAEDVHALGLTWLVDYDEAGKPLGVKYERLALALVPVIQDHEARLRAAGL